MKKMLSALLASLMLLSLAGCGGSSSAPAQSSPAPAQSAAASGDVSSDPKVTLVYAEVNPADTIVGQTAAHFKERVEELSGGSITIDVQYSGVLGSENDVLYLHRHVPYLRLRSEQLRRAEVHAAVHPLHL